MSRVRIVAVIRCGKTGVLVPLTSSNTHLLHLFPAIDECNNMYSPRVFRKVDDSGMCLPFEVSLGSPQHPPA